MFLNLLLILWRLQHCSAAAKSFQSCPTTKLPCPWDSPGKNTGVGCHFLLQCMKVKGKSLSHVGLLATPWTAAHQAPPSLGFSRQGHWTGLPFPAPMHESESEVAQSRLTLSNPTDCSLPGSSVHGIFQARVLEWVAITQSVINPAQSIWKWKTSTNNSNFCWTCNQTPVTCFTLSWISFIMILQDRYYYSSYVSNGKYWDL